MRTFRYASPATFYTLATRLQPFFMALAVGLAAIGLWIGLFVAPTDAQQGEGYRIIFVHVPASWMSMFLYCVMAFWAAVGLAFNVRLAAMAASAIAPTGALFAFLSLVTGSLWGKPMWGTYWVWDARLTSELILFFLYVGFIALQSAIDDPRRADKSGWTGNCIFSSRSPPRGPTAGRTGSSPTSTWFATSHFRGRSITGSRRA
jgi:heme exporter protein C